MTSPVRVFSSRSSHSRRVISASRRPGAGTGSGQGTGCFGCTFGINQWGTIAGSYLEANNVFHGFVPSSKGAFTTFEAPGADTTPGSFNGTSAQSINDWGAVAGYSVDAKGVAHGYPRSPDGTFTTFDATGAGTSSYQGTGCFSDCPVGLNDWGVITGSYWDSNNVQQGYLRTPEGSFVTIDPPGSTGTQPESINDSGAIMGYYLDANNVYHGFLRAQ